MSVPGCGCGPSDADADHTQDVMYREMTVLENLEFSAFSRLPTSMSAEQKSALVESVLELLDLSHLRYSQIGDENVRGISGGQRKRVNIGLELVSDPTLLFLDGKFAYWRIEQYYTLVVYRSI